MSFIDTRIPAGIFFNYITILDMTEVSNRWIKECNKCSSSPKYMEARGQYFYQCHGKPNKTVTEDSSILECCVSLGKQFPMLQRIIGPSSSRSSNSLWTYFLYCLTLKMKALCFFNMLRTTHPLTQSYNQKTWIFSNTTVRTSYLAILKLSTTQSVYLCTQLSFG
jgi:ssDNA-binding Zn-finger/Zn-ribbon topoisomerase 1